MQQEQYQTMDSLEVLVKDKDGKIKDVRFVKTTETGYKEFIPNSTYKLLRKFSNPPMVFPLGKWTYFSELVSQEKEITNGNS